MKKVLIVILTAAATLCQAQDADPRNKLYLGIKAGYNYSSVYDTQGETFEAKSKIGIAAGVFATIPFGKHLGVHPEVLFAQRGFKRTGTLLGSSYELARTSSYLDLPVLIALKPNRFLTLVAGPQFSFLLKQKDVLAYSATSIQQEEAFKNDNIRRNMLCAIAGLDINLNPVVLGLRAGWDMQHNNGDGTSTSPRYKNAWFQGTVGLGFR
jgi:hypothetical protein